jgi:hypothetical protein
MDRKLFVLLGICGLLFFNSCKTSVNPGIAETESSENRILQQADGTISLKVDKADCYHDNVNPSSNTAEWNVRVSKSGRFNVWLSSATKDTTSLNYEHSVMLSILDNRLEANPGCDKIVHNSKDVNLPYFRADSFMGSLYIQDTGLYSIQLISEKILPDNFSKSKTPLSDDSRLLSVFFTPITR